MLTTPAHETVAKTYSCEKNRRIAEKGKETRQRHSTMNAKTYTLGINKNMNNAKKEKLQQLFLQTKWMYNDIISFMENNNIHDYNDKVSEVEVKMGKHSDQYETRQLDVLPARVKQGIIARVKQNLSSLTSLKKNGKKVGKLDYAKATPSVPLSQLGIDFKVDRDNNRIFISKVGWFKVRGMKQIPQDAEITNATVNMTPSGITINVTAYSHPQQPQYEPGTVLGIDMGIATAIVTSDGELIDSTLPVTPRIKNLQRKLSRQKKGSNNYRKTCEKIVKCYDKLTNQKNDIANKIVHRLMSTNEFLVMQDENITGWKGLFGKKIQTSILGRVKVKLVAHPRVIVLKRQVATTQYCPACEKFTKHGLDKRVYTCKYCGYVNDRDVHAASNMVILAVKDENNVKFSSTDEETYRRLRTAVYLETLAETETAVVKRL